MTEQKLRELLEDMSLEEKVNQLVQLPGTYYKTEASVTGSMGRREFTEKQISQAGSTLGIWGAETICRIQESYMEKQPHHIPLLFMLDVIHGLRTVFPIPLAQGASFHPELARDFAFAAAKESVASGVHVTFAPMTDLVRDPRWGRVMESTGEDSFLNSQMAEAMVRGFRGKMASCIKHFAGYGAAEGGREYNSAELSRHTLREYYLPSYEAGITAGCDMVMASFNTIDGIPSTGNKWLLRHVLREEMGFEGVLISDWGAVGEMISHGYCEDKKEAAFRAIDAGVDIDMCTDVYANYLPELMKEGKVKEKLVDEAVLRVLHLKNKLGLFENPYGEADEAREREVVLCKEHRKLARDKAAETFVLLKNEGGKEAPLFPLDFEKSIAFIGPYVDSSDLHSRWAVAGDGKDAVSVRQAAEEMLSGEDITFCRGCPAMGENEILFGSAGDEKTRKCIDKETSEMLSEAVKGAQSADTVVLFLGEHRLQSGEAASRGFIELPKRQMELFRKVCEVSRHVAVVLFNGRPLDLREIEENARAILEVWLPGTEGGYAIVDVLTGKKEPSGRLPMSFPYCGGQIPVYYNQCATGRPKQGREDKDFYRSRYLDIPNEPLYAFGYGLGYTSFQLSEACLSRDCLLKGEDGLQAWADVANTGSRPGTETVQLYIRDKFAGVVRPVRELKGFQRVSLKPGETKRVIFEIKEEMLRFHQPDGSYVSEPGIFELWIGSSSETDNQVEFRLL